MSTPGVTAEFIARVLLQAGFWLPLAVCTYLALTPSPPESLFRLSDMLLHGFAFTYLTFALGTAHRLRRWWYAALWMLAYGLCIEAMQSFEPARTAELKDIGTNMVGIALGLLGLRFISDWVRDVAVRVVAIVIRNP